MISISRLLITGAIILTAGNPIWAFPQTYTPPVDLTEAMGLCDNIPLRPAEGIWEFPTENLTAMILREGRERGSHGPQRYTITVIETPDTYLNPGDTIGFLEDSGDPKRFAMTLYTRRGPSTLMQPARLLAELNTDEDLFKVRAEKWSLKLNLAVLLKGFWRIVKLHHDDPLKNLPAPVKRVYPRIYRNTEGFADIHYL